MKAPVGLLSRRPVCEANAACSARQGRSDFDALQPGGDCSLLPHKREPERTAVPGGHESPSGAFKPQTGLRSKCRVFSAARARRFRRAGPTRKGLLAPFNPKEDGLHTKKLAASLNAFLCSAISRPLSRCGGSSPQGSGCALSVTFGDTSPKGRGKKHSQYALGTLSKKRQETCPPQSWLSLRESWREAPERVGFPPGCLFSPLTRMLPQGASGSRCRLPLRPFLVKMRLERPCGCAAMKAPVGLSSRRAVCDSRWKDFVLTSVGAATNAKLKIIFPLKMPRVKRRAF